MSTRGERELPQHRLHGCRPFADGADFAACTSDQRTLWPEDEPREPSWPEEDDYRSAGSVAEAKQAPAYRNTMLQHASPALVRSTPHKHIR